jgi:hypothetical protein
MRMSAAELGDNLAQLVWESFTDFLERQPVATTEADQEAGATAVVVPTVEPEEALIFFMWLHTRACQQAYPDQPGRIRPVLDAMHKALYEDLEAHAISRVQLPLFEQRVTARYTEYYEAAANLVDQKVVEVAARNLLPWEEPRPAVVLDLAEATTVTAGPLRDFLQDIELEED